MGLKYQNFTRDSNFHVPPGVTSIRVIAVGGSGGGGTNGYNSGGAGGYMKCKTIRTEEDGIIYH